MPQPDERTISVLVVDDHPMLREGVAAVLQLQEDLLKLQKLANTDYLTGLMNRRSLLTAADDAMPGNTSPNSSRPNWQTLS